MSETQDPWQPRGWVGAREAIDPFKAELDAHVGGDSIGIVNPPSGALACVVDKSRGLVGFAVAARPDYEIVVPDGAFEMTEPVAAALLSVFHAGREPGT